MRLHGCCLTLAATLSFALVEAPAPASAQTVAPRTIPSRPSASTPPAPRAWTGEERADTSIGGLFSGLVTDVRRLPSLQTFEILSAGALGASLSHPYDTRVSSGLSGIDGLDGFMAPGRVIGGAYTQMGAAVATYAIGRVSGSPRTASLGADLVRAQILTQSLTMGIKYAADRTRPDGTALSFPSGHTSTTFATATVLQRHLGWKAGAPAYALAGYVAASRIQSEKHFLSDVALGAALGIVGGRTVTIGRGDARFAVAPTAAPGGAGVSFTWLGAR
jgi:membrane-associated phospholipid phosphatase